MNTDDVSGREPGTFRDWLIFCARVARTNSDVADPKAAEILKNVLVEFDERSGGRFQTHVAPWMQVCFGPEISNDRVERGDRLLEEVLELLQSGGYDPARVAQLVAYVWGRPVGQPAQEVGGVMVTLAAYCLAHGLDMHEAGETELARIWTKVDQIREKQALKAGTIGASPLPVPIEQFAENAKISSTDQYHVLSTRARSHLRC